MAALWSQAGMRPLAEDESDEARTYHLGLQGAVMLGDVTLCDVSGEANTYFGRLVGLLHQAQLASPTLQPPMDATTLARIVKEDLGYLAGYQDDATRARIEALYDCYHPIFGRIKDTGPVSSAEAFALGEVMAAVGVDQRAGIRETFVAMKRLQQGTQRRAAYAAGEWPTELEPEDTPT